MPLEHGKLQQIVMVRQRTQRQREAEAECQSIQGFILYNRKFRQAGRQAGRQGQESAARAKVQEYISCLVYNPARTESRAGAYEGFRLISRSWAAKDPTPAHQVLICN